MIVIKQKGDFKKTESFLNRAQQVKIKQILDNYGKLGVQALANATPKDTGKTANSWSYEVSVKDGGSSITWSNSNTNKGVNIAVLLQYGHGTRNGGYVKGRDYINPALQPIFDEIANTAWKEVIKS